MNRIRLCRGGLPELAAFDTLRARRFLRARIASTILTAVFLPALLAGCGSNGATTSVENDAGREIYMQNCVICHGDSVTGENALPRAPVHGPEGHTWHHADGQLTGIIDGTNSFPGRSMPSFGDKLTESEITSVLEYIKAGWLPEQLSFHAEVSENWKQLTGGDGN